MKSEPEKRLIFSSTNTNNKPAPGREGDSSAASSNPLELALAIFCADSLKRLEGRAGFAIPFVYKNPSTKTEQKLYSIHIFYQIFIGSIGGVASGIETGYLSFSRLPTPNSPFPPTWSNAANMTQSVLRNGSVIWNISKRAVVAGLLFDLLDKNFEQARDTRDWFNLAAAGLVSGAIFGLRGGSRGMLTSSIGFGFFGGLAGFFTYFGKPNDGS